MTRLLSAPLFLILTVMIDSAFARASVDLFGADTPAVDDSGDPRSVVLGVQVFSDLPGQILGCSFHKSATNNGIHVVSLWDSVGRELATQIATGETTSGKQSVLFSTPVPIAANQTFTCGYFAPNGHYSYERNAFTVQRDVPPLHVPVNGGVFVYGTRSTAWPTTVWLASDYGVDVLFSPATGSATWLSGTYVSPGANSAKIVWNTAVPSDSQVEYGLSEIYGNTTILDAARVSAHSVLISGLLAGTKYHFRVRSRDADAVLAIGLNNTFTLALPVSISTSPSNATISSGANQQFIATVRNTPNTGVTWSATAGTISATGRFTAPTVQATTLIIVTANSQADTSKSASATLIVTPGAPAIAVIPASLSVTARVGGPNILPINLNITNVGAGTLTFTCVSDQPWLVVSACSGTAPSTLQVSSSLTGLRAGTYGGHVTLAGGGSTKVVTVVLTMTLPSVMLSWQPSSGPDVVSYSLYRSTVSGTSYGLLASAIRGLTYVDQTAPSGVHYYVVTAVNDRGESAYSNEIRAVVP